MNRRALSEKSFPGDHGREPQDLSLPQLIKAFLAFRRGVVRCRTEHRLKVAKERAHILEGFQLALAHLDDVIDIVHGARDLSRGRG